MSGMNASTGASLSGLAHLRQSVRDILTTPIGSRVMQREYGSRLFELIDAPTNAGTIADIISATADALARWEPRIKVKKVEVNAVQVGQITVTIYGVQLVDGQPITLEGIEIR